MGPLCPTGITAQARGSNPAPKLSIHWQSLSSRLLGFCPTRKGICGSDNKDKTLFSNVPFPAASGSFISFSDSSVQGWSYPLGVPCSALWWILVVSGHFWVNPSFTVHCWWMCLKRWKILFLSRWPHVPVWLQKSLFHQSKCELILLYSVPKLEWGPSLLLSGLKKLLGLIPTWCGVLG